MIKLKMSLIILIIFLYSCSNGINSNKNDEIVYISESNTKIADIKYLIGVRLGNISKDEKIESEFKSKEEEINKKYSEEINKLIISEGFSERDFPTQVDTAYAVGEPIDDYHQKKEVLSSKISDLKKKNEGEINELRNSLVSLMVKDDKFLQDLVNDYRNITKIRDELLIRMKIDKNDSSIFYNKKIRANIRDEILDDLLTK